MIGGPSSLRAPLAKPQGSEPQKFRPHTVTPSSPPPAPLPSARAFAGMQRARRSTSTHNTSRRPSPPSITKALFQAHRFAYTLAPLLAPTVHAWVEKAANNMGTTAVWNKLAMGHGMAAKRNLPSSISVCGPSLSAVPHALCMDGASSRRPSSKWSHPKPTGTFQRHCQPARCGSQGATLFIHATLLQCQGHVRVPRYQWARQAASATQQSMRVTHSVIL